MMKKFLMFFVFLIMPIMAFCQIDSTGVIEPGEPPSGWMEIITNPYLWFASFAGVSFLTAFIAAFFNGILKLVKDFHKQLCAWVVAIVLLVISDLVGFGYAKDFPIILAVIHGFFAGLASNGWFDIPTLKSILKSIEALFNKA